jgi:Arc/MetJ family transcription regulator
MADKDLADRIEMAVADAEAGGDAEPAWVRHREPSSSPTAVYSVRIPVDRLEELRELAAARGVQPTALIRAWVLAHLDSAREADDYAQRWEREVHAATEHLRRLLQERPGGPMADAS